MRCPYIYDDGGRAQAGFRGTTGDCVVRAIAIATRRPYSEVYEQMNTLALAIEGPKARARGELSNSRTGVRREVYERYLKNRGWRWVPCVTIGSGCKVHLRPDELPGGVIIARLSKHICCVEDGVIRDIFNPSREGTRCVYGYFIHSDPEYGHNREEAQ